jgi:hypothetical protein
LGIQTPEQLFFNPLRGGLFESFMIAELLKNRLNLGHSPGIWFWRDNAGMEIDCLIEDAGQPEGGQNPIAVEIKSGKTFSEDMTSGLKHWQQISGISSENRNPVLVYAGSLKSSFKGIKLVPWKDIANL